MSRCTGTGRPYGPEAPRTYTPISRPLCGKELGAAAREPMALLAERGEIEEACSVGALRSAQRPGPRRESSSAQPGFCPDHESD
jgi:hypothetical protein